MDSQDLQDAGGLHTELTRQIIGCSFDVLNELGAGFLESVYEKALHIALLESGLAVERQKPIGSAVSIATRWRFLRRSFC